MATKKQRRRREKLQRHEYEYVVETEEGEEVVDTRRATQEPAQKQPKLVDRRGREIKPPSWDRVLKRTAIFAPIMLVLLFLMGGSLTLGQKLVQLVFLLVIFMPFSYFVDRLVYRSALKRAGQSTGRRA
jgi:hypothetical protein